MSSQAADVQEAISMSPEPATALTELPRREWRDTFFTLPEATRKLVVADMDRSELEAFIDLLDPDEVTDVLGYADEETRATVLSTLATERREKIEFLLSFDPESAAGLMDLDFVTVDESRAFPEVTERVRRFEERTGRVPTIFVTDDDDDLPGELPGIGLSMADPEPIRLRTTSGRRRPFDTTVRTKKCWRCSSRTASEPSQCSTTMTTFSACFTPTIC